MGWIMKQLMLHIPKLVKLADDKRMAKQQPIAGIEEKKDIAYTNTGNPMHRLNVYYPQGIQGDLPIIVNIHGGGFVYGDKDLNRFSNQFMASKGFVVVAMSYRLLSETDLKGVVQDLFNCLHWFEANAAKYHGDLSNVFICGDSAGGHLSGLVTCIQLDSNLQMLYDVTPVSFPIRAIGMSHGVPKAGAGSAGKGKLGKMIDNKVGQMIHGMQPSKSPLLGKIAFEDTCRGLDIPPIFLVSCEKDGLHTQTLELAEYLKQNNIEHELLYWDKAKSPKLKHVFNVTNPEWPESIESNTAMTEFFKKWMV